MIQPLICKIKISIQLSLVEYGQELKVISIDNVIKVTEIMGSCLNIVTVMILDMLNYGHLVDGMEKSKV